MIQLILILQANFITQLPFYIHKYNICIHDKILLYKLIEDIFMAKNTAGRGLTAHTAVLYTLVKKDLEILLPWGDHYAYDLAYYSRGKSDSAVSEPNKAQLVRVQCKLARISPDGGYITFNAFRVSPGDNGRRSVKRGYRGEAEYFGVYSPDTD